MAVQHLGPCAAQLPGKRCPAAAGRHWGLQTMQLQGSECGFAPVQDTPNPGPMAAPHASQHAAQHPVVDAPNTVSPTEPHHPWVLQGNHPMRPWVVRSRGSQHRNPQRLASAQPLSNHTRHWKAVAGAARTGGSRGGFGHCQTALGDIAFNLPKVSSLFPCNSGPLIRWTSLSMIRCHSCTQPANLNLSAPADRCAGQLAAVQLVGGLGSAHIHKVPSAPAVCSADRQVSVQVGDQFVNQYYTVMKSTPKYLHRFYTDASTFTFHDPGHGNNTPYSFTARSQKVSWHSGLHRDEESMKPLWASALVQGCAHTNSQWPSAVLGSLPSCSSSDKAMVLTRPVAAQSIHDRVLALGFDTCNVDLFSVDSQFSQESPNAPRGVPDPRGVMVLVTGALTFQVAVVCAPSVSAERPAHGTATGGNHSVTWQRNAGVQEYSLRFRRHKDRWTEVLSVMC